MRLLSESKKCLHRLAADIKQVELIYEGIFICGFLFKNIMQMHLVYIYDNSAYISYSDIQFHKGTASLRLAYKSTDLH